MKTYMLHPCLVYNSSPEYKFSHRLLTQKEQQAKAEILPLLNNLFTYLCTIIEYPTKIDWKIIGSETLERALGWLKIEINQKIDRKQAENLAQKLVEPLSRLLKIKYSFLKNSNHLMFIVSDVTQLSLDIITQAKKHFDEARIFYQAYNADLVVNTNFISYSNHEIEIDEISHSNVDNILINEQNNKKIKQKTFFSDPNNENNFSSSNSIKQNAVFNYSSNSNSRNNIFNTNTQMTILGNGRSQTKEGLHLKIVKHYFETQCRHTYYKELQEDLISAELKQKVAQSLPKMESELYEDAYDKLLIVYQTPEEQAKLVNFSSLLFHIGIQLKEKHISRDGINLKHISLKHDSYGRFIGIIMFNSDKNFDENDEYFTIKKGCITLKLYKIIKMNESTPTNKNVLEKSASTTVEKILSYIKVANETHQVNVITETVTATSNQEFKYT